jgi:hypothetical protein
MLQTAPATHTLIQTPNADRFSCCSQLDAQLGVASGCLAFLATLAWAGCVYRGSSSIASEEESTLYGMNSAALGSMDALSSPSSSTSSIWKETGVRSSSGTRSLAQLVLLSCLPYVVLLVSTVTVASGPCSSYRCLLLLASASLECMACQTLMHSGLSSSLHGIASNDTG